MRLFKRLEALIKRAKRPETKTAAQVYLYLYEFIEGFDGGEGWDEFILERIDDPNLDSIRVKASLVELPVDKEGLVTLRSLLSETVNHIGKIEQLAEPTTGQLQYIHLTPDISPSVPISHRPFSAVVIISAQVTPEWRHEVSEWLVEEGCLSMMAWGMDCSLWDDSVDIANLEAHNWENIPFGQSVMTTWHEKEPLSDVFWNAHMSNFHPPEVSIDHLVILDIVEKARESTIRELYVKSCKKVE